MSLTITFSKYTNNVITDIFFIIIKTLNDQALKGTCDVKILCKALKVKFDLQRILTFRRKF